MRRLILIFLLVILPLQASWAVASAYCAHEAAPTSAHPGHHEHGPGSEEAEPGNPLGIDIDCADCHFSNVAIPCTESAGELGFSTIDAGAASRVAIATLQPERPERPKWQRAA